MHPRQVCPPALLRLAAEQGGVLTREQALGHALRPDAWRRLLRDGAWRSLAPGIALTQPTEPGWIALAWAGVLAGGDHARLGGTAAAYLDGLLDQPPLPIRVLVPMGSPRNRRGPWEFVRERPGVRSPRRAGDPPKTLLEDTVLDLVQEAEPDDVVNVLTKAVQSRRTTPDRLLTAAAKRSRLRHRELLRQVLGDVAEGAESPLEIRYLRDVERAHGLPRASRQVRHGRFRSDVRYERFGLLVELDGRAGHEGAGRFRDMRRDNHFLLAGALTLRYGWADVSALPCRVAFQVASILVRQGWAGRASRCPRCQQVPDDEIEMDRVA